MIAFEVLEHFEIAGRTLRVSIMPPDRLQACNCIGQGIRLRQVEPELVPLAVATILKAMVIDNHPDVRSTEIAPHLTQQHFEQTAHELARQLLLSLPLETIGKA